MQSMRKKFDRKYLQQFATKLQPPADGVQFKGPPKERTYAGKRHFIEQKNAQCAGKDCGLPWVLTDSTHIRKGNEVKCKRGNLHMHYMGKRTKKLLDLHRKNRLAKLRVPSPENQSNYFKRFVEGIGPCCLLCLECHTRYHMPGTWHPE